MDKGNDDLSKIKSRIEELVNLIMQYDYHYYVLNKPLISDVEYDALFEELKNLERQYPQFKLPFSPTQRIGSDLDNSFAKYPHKIEMLSLDKIYNIEDAKSWFYKNIVSFSENFKNEKLFFTIEYKYDGLSAVLYYENGFLVRALTRGDGEYGKDITENVKTIKNIPLKLKENIDAAIKGEIVIGKDDFEKLNKEEEEEFANPRNFAAGIINRIKSSEVAKVPLKFIAYDLYIFSSENILENSSLRYLNFLRENGFLTDNFVFILKSDNDKSNLVYIRNKMDSFNIDEIDLKSLKNENDLKSTLSKFLIKRDNYILSLKNVFLTHIENFDYIVYFLGEIRKDILYPVDGLVIKIDNIKFRNNLGSTFHHPRWAFAYKFESPKGISKIIDVVFQVGRGGRVTPVAILEPIEISGSIVQKATLHNEDYIKSLELSINDTVSVSKRGEIIPAVEEVLEKDPSNSKPIIFPEKCPFCNTLLVKIGPIHFCQNEDCSARKIERIKYFVSRNGMNIETLGEKIVTFLFENGFVKDIPDLYTFNYDILINYEGFGEKKISAIKESIEKSKENDFITVLSSLGFKSLGRQTCELLIKNGFNSIDKFLEVAKNKEEDKLLKINGVGPKLVQIIFEEFSNQKNIELINKLKDLGLNFEYRENLNANIKFEESPFYKKKFVVTGSFDNFNPRTKAEEIIKKLGGLITESVSSKTDFLLLGKNPGSKFEKAQKLNVKIINEDEFIKMLNEIGIDYKKFDYKKEDIKEKAKKDETTTLF
jgi:DNA ligase (NAD+)